MKAEGSVLFADEGTNFEADSGENFCYAAKQQASARIGNGSYVLLKILCTSHHSLRTSQNMM